MSEPTELHKSREEIAKLKADLAEQWSPWKNGYYYLAGELADMNARLKKLEAESGLR